MEQTKPQLSLDEVIDIVGLTHEEAISAILTAASPPDLQSSALRVDLSTQGVWDLLESANFSCQKCDTRLRIGIHRNVHGEIHVLCKFCQESDKRTPHRNRDRKLEAFTAAMSLFNESGNFPSMSEITNDIRRAGNTAFDTGGNISSFVKWLAAVTVGEARNIVRRYTTHTKRPLRPRPIEVRSHATTTEGRLAEVNAAFAKAMASLPQI